MISSGGELLRAERDDKTLELTFYAPTRAIIRLHLESAPTRVEIDPDMRLETKWTEESGVLEVPLLRGAAPDFLRVLRIHLHYVPHVTEKEKDDAGKYQRGQSEVDMLDAVGLPLATDFFLPSFPPLVVADRATGGQMTLHSKNRADDFSSMNFNLDGPFRGSAFTRPFSGQEGFTRLRFQPVAPAPQKDLASETLGDGLLHGQLDVRHGRDHKGNPVLFVSLGEHDIAHYKFDFDRDGSDEWILESPELRLIVSPEDGGRVVALVHKETNEALITLGGALQDVFVSTSEPAQAGESSPSEHMYTPAWVAEDGGTALQATYGDLEHAPATVGVEKTIRFTSPETIEVAYRVTTGTVPGRASPSGVDSAVSFESVMGVPVIASGEEHTEFCWQLPPVGTTAKPYCEDFTPAGDEIHI